LLEFEISTVRAMRVETGLNVVVLSPVGAAMLVVVLP
jgi:hypothetical protein